MKSACPSIQDDPSASQIAEARLTDTRQSRITFLPNKSVFSMRLEQARIIHITSIHGVAWITLEGDSEDYILSPASPLTFTGPGLLVVEAIDGDTRFNLEME